MAEKRDPATVEALFRKHGAMVYRRARRILGRHEDAEEAMHEVFIRVLRGGEQFEGRSEITTWLYQITTNYCLNALRDRKRRVELMEANIDAGAGDPAAPIEPAELLLVRRLLAEADERQARAVVYVYLDGLPQDQAASLLGVSQRTVSNLVDRFMQWARARLDEREVPGGGEVRNDVPGGDPARPHEAARGTSRG